MKNIKKEKIIYVYIQAQRLGSIEDIPCNDGVQADWCDSLGGWGGGLIVEGTDIGYWGLTWLIVTYGASTGNVCSLG